MLHAIVAIGATLQKIVGDFKTRIHPDLLHGVFINSGMIMSWRLAKQKSYPVHYINFAQVKVNLKRKNRIE